MSLPPPRACLDGVIWLPRLLAKARLLAAGALPPDYAARFCHPGGVDGQFLAHFGLTREVIEAGARLGDGAVVAWFRGLPSVTAESVAAWNDKAVNLGHPGYPLAERLPVARTTVYAHVDRPEFTCVFDFLEADEGLPRGATSLS